jgi:Holliday junction resolvasome RuvABC endonuclease subunit
MACAVMAAEFASYPTVFVHPTHLKKVVTGKGKASKAEVKDFVCGWLGKDAWAVRQDVSDSAGAAITAIIDLMKGELDDNGYDDVLETVRYTNG